MKLTNDCNDTNNGFLENYARNFINHIDSLVETSMKTFLYWILSLQGGEMNGCLMSFQWLLLESDAIR